jgi:lipopolysaccharide transport system ATP-binding protein
MSSTVIQVDSLWKKYRLGVMGTGTLSHDLNRWWHRVRGKPDPYTKVDQVQKSEVTSDPSLADDEMWALQGVSFEVKQGEILGIMGRNGAGKSTLLKILSRVTAPTSGEVRVKGRIASLLEVGTGFHPELTGRENVVLNGAILGMLKQEINRKLDEIIEFSGCERYIDTPVKRYSSGMYVRLAFAVAAHLDPEILILDEVLAVGDAEFQKKCLGKMGEVAAGGRTVLFVSHNMLAVQKLCTRAIMLKAGQLHATGSAPQIVADYGATKPSDTFSRSAGGLGPQITGATLLTPAPCIDGQINIQIEWFLPEEIRDIKVGIGFNTQEGERIFDSAPEDFGLKSPHERGTHKAIFSVPDKTLLARTYVISIGLWKESTVFDHITQALSFTIEAAPVGRYAHQSSAEGLVSVPCRWDELQ